MDLLIVILQQMLRFLASRFISLRPVPVAMSHRRRSPMEFTSHPRERIHSGGPAPLWEHGELWESIVAFRTRTARYDQPARWGSPPGVRQR